MVLVLWFMIPPRLMVYRAIRCRNMEGHNVKHTAFSCMSYIQGVPGGMDKTWESVPYVELYRYNPKHLYPRLNGYGDNGQRNLKLWQLLHTY